MPGGRHGARGPDPIEGSGGWGNHAPAGRVRYPSGRVGIPDRCRPPTAIGTGGAAGAETTSCLAHTPRLYENRPWPGQVIRGFRFGDVKHILYETVRTHAKR